MAFISINLSGLIYNYDISDQHVQRVLNVYDPSDSQTNEQTAKAIADGWISTLVEQVKAVEISAAMLTAENAVVPIAITPAP